MLKDFMEQYQESRMISTKHKNPKSKFWKFINSILVDMLIFIAAILTIFLALVIIYALTGQSKLRALITTITLQRIRTMEVLSTDKPVQNCNSGLLKILMILNLVIVVSLLLRKNKEKYTLLRSALFQHGENKTVFGWHKILCLTKLESIGWKYTSIQTNGWTIIAWCIPKEILDMGCVRDKMGKHPYNFKWQRNTFTHYTPNTTCSQNKGQKTL